MLKYYLVDNPLTEERTDDMRAQTVATKTFRRDDIIERMLRKGTLVTKTDAVAVLNNLEEVIVEILEEGGKLNLPLLNTSFSVSGVFEGANDAFDPERHKLNINLTKGILLRRMEKRMALQKTEAIRPSSSIVEVRDVTSHRVNEVLTPGGVVQVWGSAIKIEGNRQEVGLWFVPREGNAIRATTVVTNKPSSVVAVIPPLPAGSYTLRIVTQYTGGNLLKTPRTLTYDLPLMAV